MTTAAEAAFFRAANAAAVAYAHAPRVVRYHVRTTARYARASETFDRDVTARREDRPFPAPPDFDALSRFTVAWTVEPAERRPQRDAIAIYDIDPLRYDPTKPQGADVVVTTVRGYRVRFADEDDGGAQHLVLERVAPAEIALHDVWLDAGSGLPTRVRLAFAFSCQHGTIDLTYAQAGTAWLLTTFHFRDVAAPNSESDAYELDATYDGYAVEPAALP